MFIFPKKSQISANFFVLGGYRYTISSLSIWYYDVCCVVWQASFFQNSDLFIAFCQHGGASLRLFVPATQEERRTAAIPPQRLRLIMVLRA
jgi:hypothetical protein